MYCEDYNAYDSQSLCEEIAGNPWYMPCEWNGESCVFKLDDIVGAGGDFSDIKIEGLCDKAGGEWKCEYYCDDNNTVENVTDDVVKQECW